MKNDKDIVDQVEGWKEREFELREREQDLRHRRWLKFGRFMKHVFYGMLVLSVAAGMWLFVSSVWMPSCEADEIEELQQEQEQQQRMKSAEEAYIECVEKMGLDKCELVGERAVQMYRHAHPQQKY